LTNTNGPTASVLIDRRGKFSSRKFGSLAERGAPFKADGQIIRSAVVAALHDLGIAGAFHHFVAAMPADIDKSSEPDLVANDDRDPAGLEPMT
jgi:hypothetical protein